MESTTFDAEPQARHSGPFGQVPSRAIYDKRLTDSAVRVLAALCSHADQYGVCRPRQLSIARALGMTQGAISKRVDELVKYGHLAIIGRWRTGPHSSCYQYQIQFQPSRPPTAENIPGENIPGENIPGENIPGGNVKNIYKSSLEEHIKRERENIGADALSPSLSLLEGPIYEALCAALKTRPIGAAAREKWASGIAEMQASGITPRDIPRAVQLYRQKYTDAIPCHPQALINNWSAIGAPVNGEKPYASETGSAYQHGPGAPGSDLTDAQRDAWLTSLLADNTGEGDSA